MTKTQIQEAVVELLDGYEMTSTLFDFFLDTAQTYYENRRPWVILRTEDTSQTIGPGNTFETAKTLPEDFRRWYTRFSIVLTDSNGDPMQYLLEVPIEKKNMYRSNGARFYCNYRTKELFICGTPTQAYTVRQFYIQRAPRISADAAAEWVFDEDYHNILALTIAVYHKLGVDYDIINAKQADEHALMARDLYNSMEEWDMELALSSLNGQDYTGAQQQFGGNGMTGNVNLLA